MENASLTLIPSLLSTYGEFKRRYPDGKLLAKTSKGPFRSPYAWYSEDETMLGVFGRVDNFNRLKGKEFIFGIRSGGKQVAVSKDYIVKERIAVLDRLSPPAVVVSDSQGNHVAAYALPDNEMDLLSLKLIDDAIVINNNETMWDAETGRLISGKGTDLAPLPITSSFWFAWVSFFPNTALIK